MRTAGVAKRIFWLGMHRVLKGTELVQLRQMAEVFNPPYISQVYDQSADLRVDWDQPTTLPPEIFSRLMSYDFFYKPIDPEIQDMLNTYFDLVIVTINPEWLASFLKAFHGQIVYRVYGQPYSLSEYFEKAGLWESLASRSNLSIVPFAAETLDFEHEWFRRLCTSIVPYQISDDVFDFPRRWSGSSHRNEIAVTIPNIQNSYYSHIYDCFKCDFPQEYFRVYGPQRRIPADARIVGGLSRDRFLDMLIASSAYLYLYRNQVCYLPPIEMMQLGGPVLYLSGSLLSRFFGPGDQPGLVNSSKEAARKSEMLMNGDRFLIEEILSAQEPVRLRYDRAIVRPVFDAVFKRLLEEVGEKRVEKPIQIATLAPSPKPPFTERVLIALHWHSVYQYVNGSATGLEGIPRVIDAIVQSLAERPSTQIVLSCFRSSLPVITDFFFDLIRAGRVSIYVVEDGAGQPPGADAAARLELMTWVNNPETGLARVLVPHYYLFPEFLLSRVPLTLYLPDYLPYLLKDETFDASAELDIRNKRVGSALAHRADRILTNSNFTRDYLPDAGIISAADIGKVIVGYLPILGKRHTGPPASNNDFIQALLAGRPFLFYPTANRPNKRLDFLLRVFANLRLSSPDVVLFLTCDLSTYEPAKAMAAGLDLGDSLIVSPGRTEDEMRWLYANCLCVVLTSVAEGNFPPQLIEAITNGSPIVATRLAMIEESLGETADELLLCSPLDLPEFVDKIGTAIQSRAETLAKQETVKAELIKKHSFEQFSTSISAALP